MSAVELVPDLPDDESAPEAKKLAHRGTTNRNARGGSVQRRRRREWLVETWRADVDLPDFPEAAAYGSPVPLGHGQPACRCYRCGVLLTVDTVSPDRIKPGIEGGTYKRTNIRPACLPCQSKTGQALGMQRTNARRQKKSQSRNGGGPVMKLTRDQLISLWIYLGCLVALVALLAFARWTS